MGLIEALGAWPGAALLQGSGTAYLLVNAAHILGVALIVGAIAPLDLRLLGLFSSAPLAALAPPLTRTAGFGVALALVTGSWLFTVAPANYAANGAFLAKLGLLAAALGNFGLQHANPAFRAALAGGAITPRVRVQALLSVALWLGVLLAGRWIGFA